jgi:hypothetical protein
VLLIGPCSYPQKVPLSRPGRAARAPQIPQTCCPAWSHIELYTTPPPLLHPKLWRVPYNGTGWRVPFSSESIHSTPPPMAQPTQPDVAHRVHDARRLPLLLPVKLVAVLAGKTRPEALQHHNHTRESEPVS